MTLSEELIWRGFVNQTTLKDITDLDSIKRTFYWGVDPSADSMQIGNFAAAMMVRHFINHGHSAILLVGGATGMIGDPDGKDEERTLKSLEEIAKNKAGIVAQYKKIFADKEFDIVDNYDWFKGLNYLEFLREVGKHVPMRQMLGREFVQSRLGESGAGISYAEFSYSLIQGYDFMHLYKEKNATLQVCGADQWGNSIAGVDLIRRVHGGEAHIYSTPLILNKSTGKKFGKSEEGTIWLDEKKTSVYKFYQFWLNVDDEGVADYLKVFTLLTPDQLQEVMNEFTSNPSGRHAQKTLATEVTRLIHGDERVAAVQKISDTLFGKGSYEDLTKDDFELMTHELPVVTATPETTVIRAIVEGGYAASNGEARRLLESGAVYVNGEQLPPTTTGFDAKSADSGFAVLRVGKNKNALIRF